jgi:hypothetical protein
VIRSADGHATSTRWIRDHLLGANRPGSHRSPPVSLPILIASHRLASPRLLTTSPVVSNGISSRVDGRFPVPTRIDETRPQSIGETQEYTHSMDRTDTYSWSARESLGRCMRVKQLSSVFFWLLSPRWVCTIPSSFASVSLEVGAMRGVTCCG